MLPARCRSSLPLPQFMPVHRYRLPHTLCAPMRRCRSQRWQSRLSLPRQLRSGLSKLTQPAPRQRANRWLAGKPPQPGRISAARRHMFAIASQRNRPRAVNPGPLLRLVGAQSQPHPPTASATALMPATETASRQPARRLPAHILPSLPRPHGIRVTGARAKFIPTAPSQPESLAQHLVPAARRGRIPGPPLDQLAQAITGSLQLPLARAPEAARGLDIQHGPGKGQRSADD